MGRDPCIIYRIQLDSFDVKNKDDRDRFETEMRTFALYVRTAFPQLENIYIESFVERRTEDSELEKRRGVLGLLIINKIYHK